MTQQHTPFRTGAGAIARWAVALAITFGIALAIAANPAAAGERSGHGHHHMFMPASSHHAGERREFHGPRFNHRDFDHGDFDHRRFDRDDFHMGDFDRGDFDRHGFNRHRCFGSCGFNAGFNSGAVIVAPGVGVFNRPFNGPHIIHLGGPVFNAPGFIVHQPGFIVHQPGFIVQQPGFIVHQPGFIVHQPGFNFPNFIVGQQSVTPLPRGFLRRRAFGEAGFHSDRSIRIIRPSSSFGSIQQMGSVRIIRPMNMD